MIEVLAGRAVSERIPVQSVFHLHCQWTGRIDPVIRQEHSLGKKILVEYAAQRVNIYDLSTNHIPITPQNS